MTPLVSDISGNQYSVYRTVINEAMNDSEHLPSLPDITLKIRQAIAEDCTTSETVARLIGRDPALSALLVKAASSPLYARAVTPKTLVDVVAMLGVSAVHNLVMLHSVRCLYVIRNDRSQRLFDFTWRRLVSKTALACFLAKKFCFRAVDEVQMAALLSEVGSLSVLSAVLEAEQVPDKHTYFALCRHYSKSLGTVLLKKWHVDSEFIELLGRLGRWRESWGTELALIDILHLAIYNTVLLNNKNSHLPPLQSLSAYQKIPAAFRCTAEPNLLSVVAENRGEIQQLIDSLSG